jgi:LmbE family N-acetylglucosaminyl deacetylase
MTPNKKSAIINTVLCLVPHPDDAEYYAGGLIAKLASEGSRVYIAVTTDGIKGSFELAGKELTDARHSEMVNSAKILGAEEPIFLGYTDFEVDLLAPGVLRERYIYLIRKIKPEIVITEDPFWLGETHPVVRAVAMAAMEAINYARLPRIYPQHLTEGLKPHIVKEKYYYSEDPEKFNKFVDISATFDKKMESLAAHQSQIEFLVQGVLDEAKLAGLDVRSVFGDMAEDKLALFKMGMQMQAAEIGAKAGVELAEGFRYERFNPLVENFLQ